MNEVISRILPLALPIILFLSLGYVVIRVFMNLDHANEIGNQPTVDSPQQKQGQDNTAQQETISDHAKEIDLLRTRLDATMTLVRASAKDLIASHKVQTELEEEVSSLIEEREIYIQRLEAIEKNINLIASTTLLGAKKKLLDANLRFGGKTEQTPNVLTEVILKKEEVPLMVNLPLYKGGGGGGGGRRGLSGHRRRKGYDEEFPKKAARGRFRPRSDFE